MADIASPLNPLYDGPVATSGQIGRPDGTTTETGLATVEGVAQGLAASSEFDGDAVPGFLYSIVDRNGLVIGGLTNSLLWQMQSVGVALDTSNDPADGARKGLAIVSDTQGRDLLGVAARSDGYLGMEMRFGPQSVADMAAQIGSTTVSISALRGTYGSNVTNPRATGTLYLASVTDRLSRSFDAAQLIGGSQPTLVMRAGKNVAPMQLVLTGGQSNAGLGGATGRRLNAAFYPFSVYGFAGVNGSSIQGSVKMAAAVLTDLVAGIDHTSAASPGMMAAYGLTEANAYYGLDDPGYIVATAWEGSQPLESFFPNPDGTSGHYNYENMITFATRAVALAATYGRTVQCDYLAFIQGESPSSDMPLNNPAGALIYANRLGNASGNLIDTITPGLKAALNQTTALTWVLHQTNTSKGSSGEYYACIGQYQVAQARADTILAGPMYQYPLGVESGAPSTIHLGPEGRAMQGETHSDAVAFHKANGDWVPVQPVSAVRTGDTIVVTYEGSIFSQGYSLAQDANWVPAAANMGFTYTDDTSPPAVLSATITGQKQVTVKLASAPTGANKILEYAIRPAASVDGWTDRRGNLMVETARPSYLRRHLRAGGIVLPAFVRHYPIRSTTAVN